ncbi:MAG: sugar ABC transporter permease [Erysipelotrichaceae bacterium]|nr:sugar ABC transporter permease [Erysipelotrichaceae bacterium]
MEHQSVKPLKFFPWLGQTLLDSIVKFGKWLLDVIWAVVKAFINIFVYAYKVILFVFRFVYNWIKNLVHMFVKGNWKTRLSYVFMGSGHIFNGQIAKGLIYLVLQVAFIIYLFLPSGGIHWIQQINIFNSPGGDGMIWIGDLGTTYSYIINKPGFGMDPYLSRSIGQNASNSMLIILYWLLTVGLIIAFIALYNANIKGAYKIQVLKENARHVPTFKEEASQLLDEKFHVTILAYPVLTILVFTILPLIFMILLAFTNASLHYFPPASRFAWVGLDTFTKLFGDSGSWAFALGEILSWTILWAVLATFSNYIGGMILAMIINKKGIKFKRVWRTFFVISIAIPQFITLSMIAKFLGSDGPLMSLLVRIGWLDSTVNIFATTASARTAIVLINMWVGVPYTMLITSGILMNIPDELYESARIDGAGPVRQFFSITLPYMLYVTGPYLITQFIGNMNNFNVIFFLTGGGPDQTRGGVTYGKTDLLITWLYDLTIGGVRKEYAIGSSIGIISFLISAFISLIMFSRSSAETQQGDFA